MIKLLYKWEVNASGKHLIPIKHHTSAYCRVPPKNSKIKVFIKANNTWYYVP